MAHPHDRLIRFAASIKPYAVELAERVLPPEIVPFIDFSGLEYREARLLDPALRERIVDMLFRLPFFSGKEAWLQLILEAQSLTDFDMPLRTFGATGMQWTVWRHEHGETRTLPMVITVVISHDPRGWRAATDVRDMVDVTDEERAALAPWLPSVPFHLFDLTTVDESRLVGFNQSFLEMMFMSLRHARDPEGLHARIRTYEGMFLSRLDVNRGIDELIVLMGYWRGVTGLAETDEVIIEVFKKALRRKYPDMKEEAMREIIDGLMNQVTPGYRDEMLAAAEARGVEQGIEQGIEQARRETLARQIRRRFGLDALPGWLTDRLAAADGEALLDACDRVLFAERVEDVLPGDLR